MKQEDLLIVRVYHNIRPQNADKDRCEVCGRLALAEQLNLLVDELCCDECAANPRRAS